MGVILRRRLVAEVVNKWLDTQFCEGKNDNTDWPPHCSLSEYVQCLVM